MFRTWLLVSLSGCSWLGADDRTAYLDRDGDGVRWDRDCDDLNPAVFSTGSYYADGDGDGWGDPASPVQACELVPGLSVDARDCDDADSEVRPGATEVCSPEASARDEDCDGLADDLDPEGAIGARDWFVDGDGDGYGSGAAARACLGPTGRVDRGGDCLDDDPTVHPGAGERCGPIDDDCDFRVDAADDDLTDITTWYADRDDDGYGDPADGYLTCDPVVGRVLRADDCDDLDAGVHPGAEEVWYDGRDQACDGADDFDQDGDGAALEDDCDDLDAGAYPGAPEVWHDGIDQACDGENDDDADADGFDDSGYGGADCDDLDASAFPGAPEYFDGVDSDCDGLDGVCGKVTRRVPLDLPTLEVALAAACVGDVIELAPGDHATAATVDLAVTIRGVGARLVPSDPSRPQLTMRRGTLSGATVANGTAGGVRVLNGSSVRIEGVTFVDNVNPAGGGALDVERSPLTVVADCTFEDNHGAVGGGARFALSNDLTVQRAVFRRNTSDASGGGLAILSGSYPYLRDVTFEANVAGAGGGGVYIDANDGLIQGGLMLANHADGIGGGIDDEGSRTLIKGVVVDGNTSLTAASGVNLGGGPTLVEEVVVRNNGGQGITVSNGSDTTIRDSSVEANGSEGLYANVWNFGTWRVEGCTFRDNGGPGVHTGTSGTLVDSVFVGNTGTNAADFVLGGAWGVVENVTSLDAAVSTTSGAAVALWAGRVDVRGLVVQRSSLHGIAIDSADVVLEEVVVEGNLGSGILVKRDGQVVIDHLTAVGNAGVGVWGRAGTSVTHAAIVGNGTGVSGPVDVRWCDLYGNTVRATSDVVEACLDVPPGFQTYNRRLALEARDLHLAVGSPLRDAGDPAALDADGTRADLGAYGGTGDWLGSSAWYTDGDLDGLYDGWESAHGLAPTWNDAQNDSDGDGLNNTIEFTIGSNPGLADTDGDGLGDAAERAGGSDPIDPTSP